MVQSAGRFSRTASAAVASGHAPASVAGDDDADFSREPGEAGNVPRPVGGNPGTGARGLCAVAADAAVAGGAAGARAEDAGAHLLQV